MDNNNYNYTEEEVFKRFLEKYDYFFDIKNITVEDMISANKSCGTKIINTKYNCGTEEVEVIDTYFKSVDEMIKTLSKYKGSDYFVDSNVVDELAVFRNKKLTLDEFIGKHSDDLHNMVTHIVAEKEKDRLRVNLKDKLKDKIDKLSPKELEAIYNILK